MKSANVLTNPLLEPSFIPGERWSQANSLRVGASLATCGKHPELYDQRPYAVALMETSYPLLRRLFQGEWGEAEKSECFQFLGDALGRGSSPMSIVALLFLQGHSETRRQEVWSSLNAKQQAKLRLHLELAKGDPDLKGLFANR